MSTGIDRDIAIERALGRIEGRLGSIEKAQAECAGKVDGVANRLDEHKLSVAKQGGLYGALASLGVALIGAMIQRGGPS
jgi:hypothetical protein